MMALFKVEIDAKELNAWLKSTKTMQGKIVKEVEKIGVIAENHLKNEAEKNSTTGVLYDSISSKTKTTKVDEIAVIVGSPLRYYSQAMETGYKGEVKPEALERWVGLKLKMRGKKGRQFAKYLAKKIERVGTKKFRRKGPKQITRAFNKTKSSSRLNKYLKKIAEILANE